MPRSVRRLEHVGTRRAQASSPVVVQHGREGGERERERERERESERASERGSYDFGQYIGFGKQTYAGCGQGHWLLPYPPTHRPSALDSSTIFRCSRFIFCCNTKRMPRLVFRFDASAGRTLSLRRMKFTH